MIPFEVNPKDAEIRLFTDINPQMKVSRLVNRDGMVRFFDGKCCQNDAYFGFLCFQNPICSFSTDAPSEPKI